MSLCMNLPEKEMRRQESNRHPSCRGLGGDLRLQIIMASVICMKGEEREGNENKRTKRQMKRQ